MRYLILGFFLISMMASADDKLPEGTEKKGNRQCTAKGTVKSCQGKDLMAKCEDGEQVGTCTPVAWMENHAKCVCASIPAKKIDKAIKNVIKNVTGGPKEESTQEKKKE